MTDRNERLTWDDHFLNLSEFVALPLTALAWCSFAWRINQHRGKHSRGLAWPRAILIDAIASNDAPAGLTAIWEVYGIPSHIGPGRRVIDNGRRCWLVLLHVSSNQHWMADMLARAHGWAVQTTPVIDRKRGSSAVAAERGAWKASGNGTRAKTWDEALTRGIGSLVGTRQRYQKRAMQAPGLRATKRPATRRRGFGSRITDWMGR